MVSPSAFSIVQPKQSFLDKITIQQNQANPPRTVYFYNYQQVHRDAVRRICCDTAFLGQPINPIYKDRELFSDLLTKPYLDYEPQWTLVAESHGQAVGYLMGSVSPHFQRNLMFCGLKTVARMLARLLTGKYNHHPRSKKFVRWVLNRGLMELPTQPKNAAHLHMNFHSSYRGGLVAKRLWLLFEKMLQEKGVEKYYAQIYSCSERHPIQIYYRYGFTLFDQKITTMFKPDIPKPLHIICIEKRLT